RFPIATGPASGSDLRPTEHSDSATGIEVEPTTLADQEQESEMERTSLRLPPKPVTAVADVAWLAVLKSPSARLHQIYWLDSPRMELGRKFDAPIFVDDRAVSSRHAAIRYERVNDCYEFVLYDLASTNGSIVNG